MGVEAGTRDSGFGIRAEETSRERTGSRDERGRRRVVIERVWPEIDAGRFPIKRTVGEQVTVTADVFADGHDVLAGVVKYRFVPAGRPSTDHESSAEAGSTGRPSPGQQGSAGPAPRTDRGA